MKWDQEFWSACVVAAMRHGYDASVAVEQADIAMEERYERQRKWAKEDADRNLAAMRGMYEAGQQK